MNRRNEVCGNQRMLGGSPRHRNNLPIIKLVLLNRLIFQAQIFFNGIPPGFRNGLLHPHIIAKDRQNTLDSPNASIRINRVAENA